MLRRNGLWEVTAMNKPFRLPQSTLPWFGALLALQAQLWSLPFSRVLYFDTDHLPLSSSPHRLLGLWKAPQHADLAAPSEGDLKAGCFNSGMMLLRPGPTTMARIESEAARLARPEAKQELLNLKRRCPTGWNLDQPLINHAFSGAWEQLYSGAHAGSTLWRMATTFHLLHGERAKRLCGVRSPNNFAEVADSFHYMAPFRPWMHSERQGTCVQFGTDCLRHVDVERFAQDTHFANGSAMFAPWLNCSIWPSAATVWWSEFMHLDGRTRQVCQRRM